LSEWKIEVNVVTALYFAIILAQDRHIEKFWPEEQKSCKE